MKLLSMRIMESMAHEIAPRYANRAAFLSVRDDVKRALDDGWPVRAIWQTLHHEQKISFSYPTFCRLVNRLIPEAQLESLPELAVNKVVASGGSREKPSIGSIQGGGVNSAPERIHPLFSQARGPVPQPGGDQATNMAVIGGQSLLDAVKEFAQLVSRFPEETLFIVNVWVPSGTDPALLKH